MAEDVSQTGAGAIEPRTEDRPELPERPAETLPAVRAEEVRGELESWRDHRPPPSTYAPRFRALTGALTGIAIGATFAAAVAFLGRDLERPADWSAWKPSESGNAGITQIATHVGSAYRLPSGEQLVLVTGGPPQVANISTRDLPVRVAVSGGRDASVVKGKTVQYALSGLGKDGAITHGKPSVERFLLLRREALELALYSFRYVKGVKNVVVLLPPAPGEKPQNAVFFRRSQLEPALQRPLATTLPHPPPPVSSAEEAPEARVVKQLTDRSLFRYAFQQRPDYGVFLVLDRIPPIE